MKMNISKIEINDNNIQKIWIAELKAMLVVEAISKEEWLSGVKL